MSDVLEKRYRRVLMMLPRAYRADHAEEMLAVLMDGAKPGQARPRARDVLSVAGLAARLRFAVGGAGGSGRLAGDVLRRAIPAYLMLQLGLVVQWDAYGARVGYFFISPLLMAGVIVALVRGWTWCGRVLCVVYGGYLIHSEPWWVWRHTTYRPLVVIGFAPPMLALATAVVVFHRRAPRLAGPNRWFAAWIAITVAFGIRGATIHWMQGTDISHTPALSAFIYATAATMALRYATSSPVWPSALALAGLPLVSDILLAHPDTGFADSVRDTFYLEAVIGCEALMLAMTLASLLFQLRRRRTAMSGPAAG